MNTPSPAEIQELALKSAGRTVKELIAARGLLRPLTADEDRVLGIGIAAGINAMLQELHRHGLLSDRWNDDGGGDR